MSGTGFAVLDASSTPNLIGWPRLCYITGCSKVALFDWLLHWAEQVEEGWEDRFVSYPFAACSVWATLIVARDTLSALTDLVARGRQMSVKDAPTFAYHAHCELTRLANALASARGMPERASWDASDLEDLTYLLDLVRCDV